jgi:hypothetical protein
MLQNLDALFLIYVSKNKVDGYSIIDTVHLSIPTKQIIYFPTFNFSNVLRLALQQEVSRLETEPANLWTFTINITSPLRINFPLLNPTELRHYHVTCIVLLPRIKFQSSFNSSLSLACVMYAFSAPLL